MPPRYSGSCLPGWLVTTFCLRGSIMASQQKDLVNNSGPRFYSQLGKVRASYSSGFQFLRCLIQASMSPYRPLSGQHYLHSASNGQAIWSLTSIGSSIILHYRSDWVYGQSPGIGESFQENSSVGIEGEMVSKSVFVGQHYFSVAVVCQIRNAFMRHFLLNNWS